MEARRSQLDKRRKERKELADEQVRQGRRPHRERNRRMQVVIAAANVTANESLKSELEHGEDLKDVDDLHIQEHTLKGEPLDKARRWAAEHGWDSHLDEAYVKESKPGGGTGVLAKDSAGVRPLGTPPQLLEGRCTMGAIDLSGAVVVMPWYGISGGCLAHQLPLLQCMAEVLRSIGLPFIVGGGWQITAQELLGTDLHTTLVASTCAGDGGTNLYSGRRTD